MSNWYIPEVDCVFIHIPKTGGLSVRRGIFKGKGRTIRINRRKVSEDYANVFSFGFIRNPYDRLISAWKMLTRDWENLPQLTLLEFLDIVTDGSIKHTCGNTYRNYKSSCRHHTLPQTHRYNCLDLVDYVAKFENYSEEWAKICKIIEYNHQEPPHVNQSQFDKSYMKYYDKQSLDIANEYFKKDFEILSYEMIKELP